MMQPSNQRKHWRNTAIAVSVAVLIALPLFPIGAAVPVEENVWGLFDPVIDLGLGVSEASIAAASSVYFKNMDGSLRLVDEVWQASISPGLIQIDLWEDDLRPLRVIWDDDFLASNGIEAPEFYANYGQGWLRINARQTLNGDAWSTYVNPVYEDWDIKAVSGGALWSLPAFEGGDRVLGLGDGSSVEVDRDEPLWLSIIDSSGGFIVDFQPRPGYGNEGAPVSFNKDWLASKGIVNPVFEWGHEQIWKRIEATETVTHYIVEAESFSQIGVHEAATGTTTAWAQQNNRELMVADFDGGDNYASISGSNYEISDGALRNEITAGFETVTTFDEYWSKENVRISGGQLTFPNVGTIIANNGFDVGGASGNWYAFLNEDNKLYFSEGDPFMTPFVEDYDTLDFLEGIQVAVGDTVVAVLQEDGSVKTFGNGPEYGHDDDAWVGTVEDVSGAPIANIVSIAAEHGTFYALDVTGEVWAWGSNSGGALGQGSSTGGDDYAKRVLAGEQGSGYLTDIVSIVAGANNAIALDSNGDVYAWGSGLANALGQGAGTANTDTPVQVHSGEQGGAFLSDIIAIYGGSIHDGSNLVSSYTAQDEQGRFFSWGSGHGHGHGANTATNEGNPLQIHGGEQGGSFLTNVDYFVNTGQLMFATDSLGDHYAWGGRFQNSIRYDDNYGFEPQSRHFGGFVAGKRVEDASCSPWLDADCIFVLEGGIVLVAGADAPDAADFDSNDLPVPLPIRAIKGSNGWIMTEADGEFGAWDGDVGSHSVLNRVGGGPDVTVVNGFDFPADHYGVIAVEEDFILVERAGSRTELYSKSCSTGSFTHASTTYTVHWQSIPGSSWKRYAGLSSGGQTFLYDAVWLHHGWIQLQSDFGIKCQGSNYVHFARGSATYSPVAWDVGGRAVAVGLYAGDGYFFWSADSPSTSATTQLTLSGELAVEDVVSLTGLVSEEYLAQRHPDDPETRALSKWVFNPDGIVLHRPTHFGKGIKPFGDVDEDYYNFGTWFHSWEPGGFEALNGWAFDLEEGQVLDTIEAGYHRTFDSSTTLQSTGVTLNGWLGHTYAAEDHGSALGALTAVAFDGFEVPQGDFTKAHQNEEVLVAVDGQGKVWVAYMQADDEFVEVLDLGPGGVDKVAAVGQGGAVLTSAGQVYIFGEPLNGEGSTSKVASLLDGAIVGETYMGGIEEIGVVDEELFMIRSTGQAFRVHEGSLTELSIAGRSPPFQSLVSGSVFESQGTGIDYYNCYGGVCQVMPGSHTSVADTFVRMDADEFLDLKTHEHFEIPRDEQVGEFSTPAGFGHGYWRGDDGVRRVPVPDTLDFGRFYSEYPAFRHPHAIAAELTPVASSVPTVEVTSGHYESPIYGGLYAVTSDSKSQSLEPGSTATISWRSGWTASPSSGSWTDWTEDLPERRDYYQFRVDFTRPSGGNDVSEVFSVSFGTEEMESTSEALIQWTVPGGASAAEVSFAVSHDTPPEGDSKFYIGTSPGGLVPVTHGDTIDFGGSSTTVYVKVELEAGFVPAEVHDINLAWSTVADQTFNCVVERTAGATSEVNEVSACSIPDLGGNVKVVVPISNLVTGLTSVTRGGSPITPVGSIAAVDPGEYYHDVAAALLYIGSPDESSFTMEAVGTYGAEFNVVAPSILDSGDVLFVAGTVRGPEGEAVNDVLVNITFQQEGVVKAGPYTKFIIDGNLETFTTTNEIQPGIYDLVVQFLDNTGVVFTHSQPIVVGLKTSVTSLPFTAYAGATVAFNFFDVDTGIGLDQDFLRVLAEDDGTNPTSTDSVVAGQFFTETNRVVKFRVEDYWGNKVYPIGAASYADLTVTSRGMTVDVGVAGENLKVKNTASDVVHYQIQKGGAVISEYILPHEIVDFWLLPGDYTVTVDKYDRQVGVLVDSSSQVLSVGTDLFHWIPGHDIADIVIEIDNVGAELGTQILNIGVNIDNTEATIGNQITNIETSINNELADIGVQVNSVRLSVDNTEANITSQINELIAEVLNNNASIEAQANLIRADISNANATINGQVNALSTQVTNVGTNIETQINAVSLQLSTTESNLTTQTNIIKVNLATTESNLTNQVNSVDVRIQNHDSNLESQVNTILAAISNNNASILEQVNVVHALLQNTNSTITTQFQGVNTKITTVQSTVDTQFVITNTKLESVNSTIVNRIEGFNATVVGKFVEVLDAASTRSQAAYDQAQEILLAVAANEATISSDLAGRVADLTSNLLAMESRLDTDHDDIQAALASVEAVVDAVTQENLQEIITLLEGINAEELGDALVALRALEAAFAAPHTIYVPQFNYTAVANDITVPTSFLTVVDSISDRGTVVLTWGATDDLGLASTFIEYRASGGAWEEVGTYFTSGGDVFLTDLEAGVTYEFRSQSKDIAGNTELAGVDARDANYVEFTPGVAIIALDEFAPSGSKAVFTPGLEIGALLLALVVVAWRKKE